MARPPFTLGDRAKDPVIFILKDAATPFAFYRERLGAAMVEGQAIRLETAADRRAGGCSGRASYPSISFVRFPSFDKGSRWTCRSAETMTQKYRMCERRA